MNRLERILDSATLKTVRTSVATIKALASIVIVVSGLVALLYATFWRDKVPPELALTIGIALLVLVGAVCAFWFYLDRVHDPDYYEIVNLDAMLIVKSLGSHHHYTYTRKQRVRALRDELRLVEIRAHWTGVSSPDKIHVESLFDAHALLDGVTHEEGGHIHRWIYPGEALSRGDEKDVGIRQEHEDDQRQQLPYFRDGGGKYRTKHIRVTVRFMHAEDPLFRTGVHVEGKVWDSNRPIRQSNPIGRIEAVRTPSDDSTTVDYIVEVKNPRRYHSYGLRWAWEKPAANNSHNARAK